MSGRTRQAGFPALFLSFLLLTSAPATFAQEPVIRPAMASAETAHDTVIVAFGDSLFSGFHLPREEGFAPALERALIANGIRARVVNAGIPGNTSAQGLQRLGAVLDGLDRKPDLVIVGLGTNDMLRGFDPATPRANLEAILLFLKQRRIPAMLTGSLAVENRSKGYAARFDSIYPQLAGKYDVPLYPFFLQGIVERPDLMLADELHPSGRGVAEIVRRILPTVEAALGYK